jgi:short-chain fatty acids transporter
MVLPQQAKTSEEALMIQAVAGGMSRVVHRYLPDPLVFAFLLTLLVFVLGLVLTPHDVLDMVRFWGAGFWNLLAFTMQMALVLVTGHALASSRPVSRLVGAMFARQMARQVKGCHYSLLIASAYIGFMTWHGGFSGSVPLVAATKGNPMEKVIGLIPVTDTLFTRYNIVITLALIIVLPILTRLMMPPKDQVVSIDPALLGEEKTTARVLPADAPPAQRLEESPILSWLAALLGAVYIGFKFAKSGFALDINTVNLVFLILGLALHGSPMAYMRAVSAGAKETAGVIIQFPFYAGIQAMLDASGLGGLLTHWFISVATKDTFPIFAFLSSAVINFAVPSGGGHWVVQAPFVMPAAKALGADLGKSAMAIAYGEEWMNMAQPFWALPALSIAGLGVRDIMGYCMTALIFTSVIFLAGLYFL